MTKEHENGSPDYPAAHSMDADWFAIDDDGHVGVFESGEEGPVPTPRPPEGYDDDLGNLVVSGDLPLIVDDLATEADGKSFVRDWKDDDGGYRLGHHPTGCVCLVWLKDEGAFELPDAKKTVKDRWGETPPHPALQRIEHPTLVLGLIRDYDNPPRLLVRELEEVGQIQRAWYCFEFTPARCGLYRFGQWPKYRPGPYLISEVPQTPFVIDATSKLHSESFGECRLTGVRFSESYAIQPMTIVECSTWGERDWVDLDGLVHWSAGRTERDTTSGPTELAADDSTKKETDDAFHIVICSYLDGVPGSADVLNDALEELGRERVATDGDAPHRLKTLLSEVLPRSVSDRLAVDFVDHVKDITPSIESRPTERLLEIRRQFPESPALWRPPFLDVSNTVVAEVEKLANDILRFWERDNSPPSRALWAAWTLIFAQPWNTAAAAQAARANEIAWQVGRVKEML